MQAVQLILVVTLGVIVAAFVASRAAERDGGFCGDFAPKIAVGLGMGLMAALIVAALSGDIVPDAWEGPGLAAIVTTISVLLLVAFIWRWILR